MTDPTNRRDFLRSLALTSGGILAGGVTGAVVKRALAASAEYPTELEVLSGRPQDFATPIDAFVRPYTPNDVFFVRSHHGPPPEPRADWQLEITGLSDRRLHLSLADLRSFPRATVPAVLQCAGNGRAFFRPRVPGAQWRHGAMGQARWTGARLADILARIGVRSEARFVTLRGGETPGSPTAPPFDRSLPLARALDPTTIVAYEMNGAPLPHVHGAPARLVVPGWVGDDWVKWLRQIAVTADKDSGFFMATGYRLPVNGRPAPMTAMPVKSVIATPLQGAQLTRGAREVIGVAFSGTAAIARVDVSVNGGRDWRQAALEGPHAPGAWKVFRAPWDAVAGPATILAKATDADGATQPERTAWNRGGYLWNSIDVVRVQVGAR